MEEPLRSSQKGIEKLCINRDSVIKNQTPEEFKKNLLVLILGATGANSEVGNQRTLCFSSCNN